MRGNMSEDKKVPTEVLRHLLNRIAWLRKNLEEIAKPGPYPNKDELAAFTLDTDRVYADDPEAYIRMVNGEILFKDEAFPPIKETPQSYMAMMDTLARGHRGPPIAVCDICGCAISRWEIKDSAKGEPLYCDDCRPF